MWTLVHWKNYVTSDFEHKDILIYGHVYVFLIPCILRILKVENDRIKHGPKSSPLHRVYCCWHKHAWMKLTPYLLSQLGKPQIGCFGEQHYQQRLRMTQMVLPPIQSNNLFLQCRMNIRYHSQTVLNRIEKICPMGWATRREFLDQLKIFTEWKKLQGVQKLGS